MAKLVCNRACVQYLSSGDSTIQLQLDAKQSTEYLFGETHVGNANPFSMVFPLNMVRTALHGQQCVSAAKYKALLKYNTRKPPYSITLLSPSEQSSPSFAPGLTALMTLSKAPVQPRITSDRGSNGIERLNSGPSSPFAISAAALYLVTTSDCRKAQSHFQAGLKDVLGIYCRIMQYARC